MSTTLTTADCCQDSSDININIRENIKKELVGITQSQLLYSGIDMGKQLLDSCLVINLEA